ncbi:hypothetical protein, partial [Phenylobacterium sp.]|uniref:hypothetical protein n=1 Tax=Phenylobacterium sp. TaxID=1871053 RepID=UPI002ED9932C
MEQRQSSMRVAGIDVGKHHAATAQVEAVKAAQDPRLADLAERLTCYEQITDQAAELKTFLESVS